MDKVDGDIVSVSGVGVVFAEESGDSAKDYFVSTFFKCRVAQETHLISLICSVTTSTWPVEIHWLFDQFE